MRDVKIPPLALCVCLAVTAVPAHSDWIPSALDQRCDPNDIDGISNSIRDAIEASVRRAEATIQPPAAIGDLGCLDGLMNAPLDIFSNIGGIVGTLQQGLFSDLSFPVDVDTSGMLCDFAAAKWGELTQGLGDFDLDLLQFASTPADMAERLAGGGGFGSGGGGQGGTGTLHNRGSGTTTLIGENNPTGADRIPVPVSPETDGIPIFGDPTMPDVDEDRYDMTGLQNAYNDWWGSREIALVRFQACETARRLGSGGGFFNPPTTCPVPQIAPEPNIEDFRLDGVLAPTTTFSAPTATQPPSTSAPMGTSPEAQGGSELPSAPLIPAPRPNNSGTGQGASSPDRTETIDSIWGQF